MFCCWASPSSVLPAGQGDCPANCPRLARARQLVGPLDVCGAEIMSWTAVVWAYCYGWASVHLPSASCSRFVGANATASATAASPTLNLSLSLSSWQSAPKTETKTETNIETETGPEIVHWGQICRSSGGASSRAPFIIIGVSLEGCCCRAASLLQTIEWRAGW